MRVKTIYAGFALTSLMITSVAFAATGPFTAKQAEDGHVKFNNHCATCHGPKLDGALGPNLHDDKFKSHFAGKPVKDLRQFVWENMPQTAPKSLPDDQLNPIIAYILSKNGVQPGDKELSKDTAESGQFPK